VLAILTNISPPAADYEGQLHADVPGPQRRLAAALAPPDRAFFGPAAEASSPIRPG
jgi:hypothetical protein